MPTSVTYGSTTLSNALQFSNASLSTVVVLFENEIVLRLKQFVKEYAPILTTSFGIVMYFNKVQLLNALFQSPEIVDGNDIEVKECAPQNA